MIPIPVSRSNGQLQAGNLSAGFDSPVAIRVVITETMAPNVGAEYRLVAQNATQRPKFSKRVPTGNPRQAAVRGSVPLRARRFVRDDLPDARGWDARSTERLVMTAMNRVLPTVSAGNLCPSIVSLQKS
jgi:hypothetical protein